MLLGGRGARGGDQPTVQLREDRNGRLTSGAGKGPEVTGSQMRPAELGTIGVRWKGRGPRPGPAGRAIHEALSGCIWAVITGEEANKPQPSPGVAGVMGASGLCCPQRKLTVAVRL